MVRALNQDMPYDQFLIEQIAGDLLPNATQDQVIATGFLRNSMINEEGAIIPEQFRIVEMFDRMDCIGKAVSLDSRPSVPSAIATNTIRSRSTNIMACSLFLITPMKPSRGYIRMSNRQNRDAVHEGIAAAEQRLREQVPDWQHASRAWENEPDRPADSLAISGLS